MPIQLFGEWLPDLPEFGNPGATTITNVIPRTKESYGPIQSPQVYSGPLNAFCQGSYALTGNTGVETMVFAGDASRLYLLQAGSTNFSDVSKTAGGPYSTAEPLSIGGGFWWMTSFGQRVVATNLNDPIQSFLAGTDTAFSDLSGDAPRAKFAAVIKDFLMVGNTVDAAAGEQPRRVWWSAIGDPTTWPMPRTNTAIQVQSDYQDLQQSDLGVMTGLIGSHLSSADGAAFMERGIYRIAYTGSPTIFAFAVAEGASGTVAPMSIIQRRMTTGAGTTAIAFYLGEEDFYAFDGLSSVPIGVNKIAKTFFRDCNPVYVPQIIGAADPINPLVFWLYNSAQSTGLYDRLLVYNWNLQRWSLVDLEFAPLEWITRSLTAGRTLDDLDAFGPIDTLPFGLDSRIWAGGAPILSVFDSSHKLNYLTGSTMAPIVETSEAQLSPARRTKILSARPLVDTGAGSVATGARDTLAASITYTAAVPMNVIGECPQLATGRYVRFRFTAPAATSFSHLQGIDATFRQEGKR